MKARLDFSTDGEYEEYLRHYYAGLAMQGLIANAPNGHLSNSKQGVALALDWADTLLTELAKPEQP